METTQFDVNILNLHSLSINSEFMVYMKPRSSRIDKKITTQINIIINTGLFKKIAKISKSFLERDISSKLSKLMMKYSTHDLKIFNAIDFYIIVIKYSKFTRSECLSCLFWATRNLTIKTSNILAQKNFFSLKKFNDSSIINSSESNILKFNWYISIVLDVFARNIFQIKSKGLSSLNFLLVYIFYFGNFRWIINFKKNIIF